MMKGFFVMMTMLGSLFLCFPRHPAIETSSLKRSVTRQEDVLIQDVLMEDKNYLPPSYWSNYPQTGTVEVGGYAGDSTSQKVPNLGFRSERGNNFLFTITFEENPLSFESSYVPLNLGFMLEMETPEQGILQKTDYRAQPSLQEIFVQKEGSEIAGPEVNTEKFFTSQYIVPKAKAICVSFVLPKDGVIRNFRFTYAKRCYKIKNVVLSLFVDEVERVTDLTYPGDYTIYQEQGIDPHKKEVISLNSQYGSIYSIDYLIHKFPFQDKETKRMYYFDRYDDQEGYFQTGDAASIGKIYSIKCYYSKSNQSIENLTIQFKIVDYVGPSISFIDGNEITTSYRVDTNSKEFIDSHFLILDNCQGSVDAKVMLYNGNAIPKNTLGRYECRIVAYDQNKNRESAPFQLNIIDDIPPRIYHKADEIFLSKDTPVDDTYLLSLFYAEDEIDGTLPMEVVEDTYTPNKTALGSYHFTVSAKDSSLNETKENITITVVDETQPVFQVKECYFTVYYGNIPTVEDVIETLISQKVLEDRHYSQWEIIEGEELGESLSLGIHKMTLSLQDENGETVRVKLTMEVKEAKNVRTETLWQVIVNFFRKLWNNIMNFFSKS